MKTTIERFESYFIPEPNSGCWLWTAGVDEHGYGRFALKGKNARANRVSYELYVGPVPDDLFVCHRCDQPACVNPDHFFLGTRQDNMVDMTSKGRHWLQRRPEESPKRKLSDEAVRDIRETYAPDRYRTGAMALARKYGVHRNMIQRIATGEALGCIR